MRTTVTIDDAVYRDAKAAAAKAGRPLGALIEDAVRLILRSDTSGEELPPLRRFHGDGLRPGVNPVTFEIDMCGAHAIGEIPDDVGP